MTIQTAEHVKKRQFRVYNVLVNILMGFGSITMGYSASIIGTTLAQPTFIVYFELATRSNATQLISAMNGLFQAGAFVGAILIEVVGDRLGRKWAIAVPAMLAILSAALMAGSVHVAMFLLFRFVSGIGSWMLLGAVPMWMAELAPPKNRGALVNIHGAGLLLGYAFASWMGYAWYHLDSPNAWRAPLAMQALPAIIVLVGLLWVPESPRFLIKIGENEKAQAVLTRLHDSDEAEIEFAQIEAQLRLDESLPHSWASILTKKSYRKRAMFAVGVAFGTQATGILVINNYSSIIYTSLGFTGSTVLMYQAGFNMLGFGCGVLGIFIIDLFPRNKLIALGTCLVTCCLIVEAALVANFPVGPGQNNNALRAAVAMTFCYMAFAQLCLDEVQWVYYAELFPNHLRGKGVAIALATLAVVDLMWLEVAPTAFQNIGWKFYLCFIVLSGVFAIVAFFFLPDTRGLAIEEIAVLFGDGIGTGLYQEPTPEVGSGVATKNGAVVEKRVENA